ncbi:helix-turn-helix transcriptional regulator [Actinocorallia sp. API 0066]|uniref:helix-turn-helix domain-containing protein n=1 Tax=Actinocorallia sp. API 0066 TaxID=2896846 RepID=UPI001E3959DD|nr:helix-turn-helix transcriptional regulator [Actinocorallia sp. API 0066]MCD0452233.1 helix-turn-helix transcriptional regulator [Actinocorallia sp. API 0066]
MSGEAAAAARKAFGTRLKHLRLDAGLSGVELARAAGMHNTKVSRIEHGKTNPSEEDVRAWATACGAARRIPELIAAHREVDQMWIAWRRELRAGQRHIQSRAARLYETTGVLRAYEPGFVPGILQTHGYVEALFRAAARLYDMPENDPKDAADARMARQRLVTEPTGANRYSFVLEAAALRMRFGGANVMLDQLDFLARVATLPHVSLGIIPPDQDRYLYPGAGFYVFDERLVRCSGWAGEQRTSDPEEIGLFLRAFEMLRRQAVYGPEARALIAEARRRLQSAANP